MPHSISIDTSHNQLTAECATRAYQTMQAIGQKRPRVHCITSTVAQDISSDMILAIGAISSFTISIDTINELVSNTNALVVNIGTLDNNRRAAIMPAIQTASERHIPWILDPVSVHASPSRLEYAKSLLDYHPSVIRGNALEIQKLANSNSPMAAQELARQYGCIVAQTGETDLVTNGEKTYMIANGHVMQTRISAMGCATTAFIACFMALDHDAFDASVQALLIMGVSAELAATKSFGPGTMTINLLDAIYGIDQATLSRYGHVVALD